jgi:DNA relaxase NicK
MKCDWYQASVPNVPPEVVMGALQASEYYGEWVESKPSKGYDIGAQFVVGDHVKFRLNHGGQNKDFGANVTGSGSDAPKLLQVLREHFPMHRVSRFDSCEDFHNGEAYDHLRTIALKIATEHDVKAREIIKPLPGSDDGRTLYLGSPTSAITARIYEKGKQLGVGTEWVRAELQVRPQKLVKDACARLSAEDVWGLARWSLAMAAELGKTEIQRVDVQIYQPADDDRAYHWMLKQYGKLLGRMKDAHGSWETLGAQIGYDLEHMGQEEQKTTLKPVKRLDVSKK